MSEEKFSKYKRRFLAAALGFLVAVALGLGHITFQQRVEVGAEPERFVIPLKGGESPLSLLKSGGFIKSYSTLALANMLRGVGRIEPGGYQISKSMSSWEIAGVLKKGPYMKWVVIKEGLRKEEIAEIMAENLEWSDEEKNKWINVYTTRENYEEGVYFPDTYLIPLEESGEEVAERLIRRFEEKFAPLSEEAVRQNVRWPTLLKLASIVQREAAGKEDMPLVAGILWNRLLKDMRLEVDATLQYAQGDKGDGFWSPTKAEDKQIDSPYNTYKNKGLPPTPISNPGTDAIKASLFPEETKCLYYIHDNSGKIHCSETFEGHKENIEKYL